MHHCTAGSAAVLYRPNTEPGALRHSGEGLRGCRGGAAGEAGSMMFMDAGIERNTVFGDGSKRQGGGLFGKLLGAGKRLVTGESLFTTVYTNATSGKKRVAFMALGILFQQKLSVGFFGGEGFIMQKLDGDGLAFVHADGTVVRRELPPGQVLMVGV